MHEDVIMAGFGGQGIMAMGQILAYAALDQGRQVLWMPAYGPETRGGFANCTVIISNEEIGSPVVAHTRSLIIMNLPSLDRFEAGLKTGGLMILNTSLVNRAVTRSDIRVIPVAATEVATELGNVRAANMVALGAYLAASGIMPMAPVEKALAKVFEGKPAVIELNLKALSRGAAMVKETVSAS